MYNFSNEKYISYLAEILPRPIYSKNANAEEEYKRLINKFKEITERSNKHGDVPPELAEVRDLIWIILVSYEQDKEEDRFDWKEFLAAFGDIDDVE